MKYCIKGLRSVSVKEILVNQGLLHRTLQLCWHAFWWGPHSGVWYWASHGGLITPTLISGHRLSWSSTVQQVKDLCSSRHTESSRGQDTEGLLKHMRILACRKDMPLMRCEWQRRAWKSSFQLVVAKSHSLHLWDQFRKMTLAQKLSSLSLVYFNGGSTVASICLNLDIFPLFISQELWDRRHPCHGTCQLCDSKENLRWMNEYIKPVFLNIEVLGLGLVMCILSLSKYFPPHF